MEIATSTRVGATPDSKKKKNGTERMAAASWHTKFGSIRQPKEKIMRGDIKEDEYK